MRVGICIAWLVLIAFGARAAAPARIEARSADLLVVGLVQGEGEQSLEVEEARSGAFMAICEIG